MSDLINRLAHLHDGVPTGVDDAVVDADLKRAHAALVSRRHRRMAVAGAATAAVVTAGSLSYAATAGHGGTRSKVADPATPTTTSASAATTASSAPAATSTSAAATHGTAPGLRLAAYTGAQLPGYTIKTVPAGYVLQGISGSVLDIAAKDDHSDLDTFVGKIVVMLNDTDITEGKPVSVNGHPAHLDDQDGVQLLRYDVGDRHVEVQAWSNVHITADQLITFAEGVTVLPNAEVGHG
jgi:hypothetical protein